MTTTEHLHKIKAECERLIKLAEKRTQGKWTYNDGLICEGIPLFYIGSYSDGYGMEDNDGFYIAECGSGAAEAGWKATIFCVDRIMQKMESADPYNRYDARYEASKILAAWPIELVDEQL